MKAPLFLLGLGFTNVVKGDSGVPSSDDTPPSPPNDVTGVLELDEVLDEVTQCAGVSFDFDSCIVSSTLLAVADPNGPLGNLTALILGCPEESCDPPPEDLSGILNSALNDAIVSCGEETSAEEIENVTKSLDQLLTADDCFDIHVGDHIDTITGSVEGDLTLAYVAQCADVEVSAESCIFQKTMGMIFSSSDDDSEHSRHLSNVVRILEGQEGDDDGVCEAPNMDPQVTDFLVYQAGVQCQIEGHEVTFADTAEATVTLNQLFGSESEECWLNLCSGDAELALISSWLDFCADIQMPFPLPPEEDMMFNPEYYEPQVKLSCMVQFAMTSEWATFGEPSPPPGSPDECLPPGHDKMESFCPSTIAPIALEYCKNVTLLDALPPEAHEPVPSPSPTPTLSPISASAQNNNTDSAYIEHLCDVLNQLSQQHVKEDCLLPMCFDSGVPTNDDDDWYDDTWQHYNDDDLRDDDDHNDDDWKMDDWFDDDWLRDDYWHEDDDLMIHDDDPKIDDELHDDDIDDFTHDDDTLVHDDDDGFDDNNYWYPIESPPSKAPTMKPIEIVQKPQKPAQQPSSAKPSQTRPTDEETSAPSVYPTHAPSEPVLSSRPTYDFGFDDDVTFGSAMSLARQLKDAAITSLATMILYLIYLYPHYMYPRGHRPKIIKKLLCSIRVTSINVRILHRDLTTS